MFVRVNEWGLEDMLGNGLSGIAGAGRLPNWQSSGFGCVRFRRVDGCEGRAERTETLEGRATGDGGGRFHALMKTDAAQDYWQASF